MTLTGTDNEHVAERYAAKVRSAIMYFNFNGCVSVRQVKTVRLEKEYINRHSLNRSTSVLK